MIIGVRIRTLNTGTVGFLPEVIFKAKVMDSEEIDAVFNNIGIDDFTSRIGKFVENPKGGLKSASGGGPLNLGDPKDWILSDYEKREIIPQRVYNIAKIFHCNILNDMFEACCKENKYTMIFSCSAKELNDCLKEHFYNKDLIHTVAEEYLLERSHYRFTGIKTRRFNRGIFLPRPEDAGPAVDKDGKYRIRMPDKWAETYQGKSPDWLPNQ